MYAATGFGLWVMVRTDDGALLGMSGLIKRAGLDDVDLGYALLPQFEGQGYASEAARAWLAWGRQTKKICNGWWRLPIASTLPRAACSSASALYLSA